MIRIFAIAAAATLATAPAHAEWRLDNDASRISFVSTKAGQIGEVHRFNALDGAIDTAGVVRVSIDLTSVDTLIPLRDERMREMLFETAQFPEAELGARIDVAAIDAIGDGETATMTVEASLEMHGETLPLTFEFLVAKLDSSRIVVSTLQPVVVNAAQLGLTAGVEALREVAGLPSISPAVPVSAVMTFDLSL